MPRKVPVSSHWIAYAIAIAGAGSARLLVPPGTPLWVDEEMIALNARWRSFADLGGPLWLDQSAPLGWLALERAALVAFGTANVPRARFRCSAVSPRSPWRRGSDGAG
jgi:hypothetical protein